MEVPVNRHPLAFLPALDGRHVPFEVCRDFLPRIQLAFGRCHGWRYAGEWFAHRVLLIRPRLPPARGAIVAYRPKDGKAQHSTVSPGNGRSSVLCGLTQPAKVYDVVPSVSIRRRPRK